MLTLAERTCRALLQLSAGVYVLVLIIALTGGSVLTIGSYRLSARGTRNPLTILLLSVAMACALAPRGRRFQTLLDAWSAIVEPVESAARRLLARREQLAAWTAVLALAAWVMMLGVVAGAHVAGGSDSYGYVSQARLWTSGVPRVEQPLLRDRPAGVPPETLVPLGYRLSPDATSLVPTYSPGFPMLMAVFELIGGPEPVFFVVPLLAGVTVVCTYLLGARLAGPAIGVAAAALMATSPAFLYLLTRPPMSDVPAMAWWAAALALGLGTSRGSILLSGLAAGAAILTRPNLVPLTIVVAMLPLWQTRRQHRSVLAAAQSLSLFSVGPMAAALVVASLNTAWYGGPTTSGYGSLAGTLYRWDFLPQNLVRYPAWLWDTQPWMLPLVAAGAVVLWKRRALLGAVYGLFALAVCLCYAFYLPLPDWWSLRLLFPAFPILCVVAAAGVIAVPALPRSLRVAVVVMVAALGVASSREKDAFNAEPDRRFATMGRYVADSLPAAAALLTMHHSGSANFYSGRLTLRWDMLRPEQLDPLVADLQRRGYVPFILLDDFEEPQFSARFTGASRLAALDWKPIAAMPRVRLFSAAPGRIE